jgi:hypothetical protein
MTELLIIKTSESEKIKSVLTKNKLNYQIIYNEIIRDKELTAEKLEKQIAKDYQD